MTLTLYYKMLDSKYCKTVPLIQILCRHIPYYCMRLSVVNEHVLTAMITFLLTYCGFPIIKQSVYIKTVVPRKHQQKLTNAYKLNYTPKQQPVRKVI